MSTWVCGPFVTGELVCIVAFISLCSQLERPASTLPLRLVLCHVAVEEGHYRELAKQLTTQEKDWNTILGEIQEASGITHVNKDPLLTYNQYSSGAKGIVKGALEIENVGPNDSLVTRILSEELQGKDLDKAIREDTRFLNTTRAKDE